MDFIKEFFIHESNSTFTIAPYSIQNVFFAILMVVSIVLILVFAKRIKTFKNEKKIKISFAIILIIIETSYHIHNWINGVYTLPLHLSSISLIMTIIILLTDSKKIFNPLFFFGVLGGIASFLMPNMLNYTYYHMRFYSFTISHLAIMIVPLYYFKAYNYKLSLKSLYKAFGLLVLVTPIIMLVNYLMDKNYMFIGEKPEIIENYLPEWPWFILIYLGLILAFCHILYYVSTFKRK